MVDNNYGKQNDDALRRDFTINAIYYDPVKEVVVEYHGGIKDLNKNSLKMIGDPLKRYIEDPVRVLRAIRLSAKLGLSIEENTLKGINSTKELLINENRGRLFEEMLKILLSGTSEVCIDKIIQLQLPRGIFPLFDKVFFGKVKDPIALKILAKTDERIQSNGDVSAVFILSGLLWSIINRQWQKLLFNGSSPRQALCDAIQLNRSYAANIGITKNMFNAMTDVWMLQFEFENPMYKKLLKITSSPRFRQGLHLYNIRNELDEVDPKLNIWWNKFIALNTNEEKIAYIESFKKLFSSNSKISKTKKKKK
jgi:poly(A) polymerase